MIAIPTAEFCVFFCFLIFFLTFMYFWDRDTAWTGEGPRERETQNLKQAPGSERVSTEPDAGLELTDCKIMTWAEVGRPADWATQAPHPAADFCMWDGV